MDFVDVLVGLKLRYGGFVSEVSLAQEDSTPVDMLWGLALCEDKLVRRLVAGNGNASSELLEFLVLSEWEDSRVLWAVAGNDNVSSELLRVLFECDASPFLVGLREGDGVFFEKLLVVLAGCVRTPVDILLSFAYGENVELRAAVASNPSLPVEAVEVLSKELDVEVRMGVVLHPDCSDEIVLRLWIGCF